MGISVCLPVFNGSKTMRTAIESVLSQTYRDFELLIWDDGSSDDTFEIASEYDARVFRSENAGVAQARNRMLREARFDLVAMIDHDDAWVSPKLELQAPVFLRESVILAHGNCRFVEESGQRSVRELAGLPVGDPFAHILPDNRIITSSAVFRKAPLLSAGGFRPLARCSDWQGWFELAYQGDFAFDPEVLVEYAIRDDSLANAGFKFHEAQFEVLNSFVLGEESRLFARLSKDEARRYRRLARRSSGVALSSMSSCKWKERDRSAARSLAVQALLRAPRVFRVWTRAWRAFTKEAGPPR